MSPSTGDMPSSIGRARASGASGLGGLEPREPLGEPRGGERQGQTVPASDRTRTMVTLALRSLKSSDLKEVMRSHNLSVRGAKDALVSRCLNSGASVSEVMQWLLSTPAAGTSSRTSSDREEQVARMALGSYKLRDLKELAGQLDLAGTGSKEDLIDRLVADDGSAMSVLDRALQHFGGPATADTVAQATSGQAINPIVGSDQVERTDATANADTPVAIRDPNPAGFDRDAWNSTDQRQHRWDTRLNEATHLYCNSFTSPLPVDRDVERKAVRHSLQATWSFMPLNASEETLLRLRWDFDLLPKLFDILASGVRSLNYPEPEGISLLRMRGASTALRRRGASDETIHEAVAQVELHLFHLAFDAVELSLNIPGVLSALTLAKEEARRAIQRLSNPDPNDETTIAGRTLFSRGGRPVTADPVKDF